MSNLKNKLVTLETGAQAKELTPVGYVTDILKSRKNQLEQVLPKVVTPERFMHVSLNAVRTTPKLMECTTESFLGGILQCSMLGLEPNTVMGHAYLIPFWNSRKRVYEVQFIAGYRGLVELARRSGKLKSIAANVVRVGDQFEYEYGLDERLRHIPREEYDENAEITFAYAYATLEGGFKQFVVMPRGQVIAIRNNSSGYKSAIAVAEKYNKEPNSPWITHEDQMFAKTAVRRLYKLLPTSFEMTQIQALDAIADQGRSQELDRVFDGEVVDHSIAPGGTLGAPEKGDDEVPPDPDGEPPEGRKIPDSVNEITLDEKQRFMLQDFGFFQATQNGGTVLMNEKGDIFNPEIHVATPDGAPVMNANWTFRKRPVSKTPKKAPEDEK